MYERFLEGFNVASYGFPEILGVTKLKVGKGFTLTLPCCSYRPKGSCLQLLRFRDA